MSSPTIIMKEFKIDDIEFRLFPYTPFQYWDVINMLTSDDKRTPEWISDLLCNKNLKFSKGGAGEQTLTKPLLESLMSSAKMDFLFDVFGHVVAYAEECSRALELTKKK